MRVWLILFYANKDLICGHFQCSFEAESTVRERIYRLAVLPRVLILRYLYNDSIALEP